MAPNQEPDDVFKLKRFRKMFLNYTMEFKVGMNRMAGTAASPVAEATTPPLTGSGKRKPPSSMSSSEPSSDVGSGETTKGSKEGSNEKIADAKEFAKADDEEFENDGGTTTMAHSKIRNRDLKWKTPDGEEKAKDRKKGSDKTPVTPSKEKESSPYMTARGGKQGPYEGQRENLDEGIRKRRNRSAARQRKKNADKSGKSGRSGKTEKKRTTSGQRRKGNKTDETTEAKSPGRRTSPANTSPVKTDAGSPAQEAATQASRENVALSRESLSREQMETVEKASTPTTPSGPAAAAAAAADKKIECAEIDTTCDDFKTAIKVMEMLKRNNLLENALFPAQNETLRIFFEGGMKDPDRKIMELISKAMDLTLDAVFFKGEDMDCIIDHELKTFIVDRFKSKPILLDVIISRPEFLPLSWGGRTVVLRQIEATVLVQPDKKDKK